jgi:hypothetical protein
MLFCGWRERIQTNAVPFGDDNERGKGKGNDRSRSSAFGEG